MLPFSVGVTLSNNFGIMICQKFSRLKLSMLGRSTLQNVFLTVATTCLYDLAAALYISQETSELFALALLNGNFFLSAECLKMWLNRGDEAFTLIFF